MFNKNFRYFEIGYNEYGIKYKQDGKLYNAKGEEVDSFGKAVISTDRDLIISQSSGKPFKTKRAAQSTMKKKELEGKYEIIELHGGFALESIS